MQDASNAQKKQILSTALSLAKPQIEAAGAITGELEEGQMDAIVNASINKAIEISNTLSGKTPDKKNGS